ncbi:uncharacterized protein N7496_004757 [Penicillium cataractarum]|uniref:Uncharacterized protein n=1 Tax=Penicillium cataractarum TaxID=2100454 RepID=A0A9W9VCS4_9EURO|nr:uncharacterized protein N7496_004757 [Penicillium cataractarum]KAJ5377348.1 hypothetical protein N7496_004757 [Penicillium cataractarum]
MPKHSIPWVAGPDDTNTAAMLCISYRMEQKLMVAMFYTLSMPFRASWIVSKLLWSHFISVSSNRIIDLVVGDFEKKEFAILGVRGTSPAFQSPLGCHSEQ